MNHLRRNALQRMIQQLGYSIAGASGLIALELFHPAYATNPRLDHARPKTKTQGIAATGLPLILPETLTSLHRLKGKPTEYYVSEKLDGVRGYWNGKQLLFRSGRAIAAPAWFTKDFPAELELDGELWMARGKFEELSAAVRRQQPNDDEWRHIKFCLFELPHGQGEFSARYEALQSLTTRLAIPWLRIIEQVQFANLEGINHYFHELINVGGEGVVLHYKSAEFTVGRNTTLWKYKPFFDAEAQVLKHLEGTGKYQGMLGAFLVENRDGLRFKIGSGFGDEMRHKPLPIGSWLTYRYRDTNPSGIPRFATYLREYEAD